MPALVIYHLCGMVRRAPESRMNRRKLNKAIQVALVEDDAGVRANLAALLNSSPGFSCQAAYPDAMTALKAIPANRPDVVLMDINMPGMPGTECVSRLKTVAPTLPVLMLTVYDDSEQIFKSLMAGATVTCSSGRPRASSWKPSGKSPTAARPCRARSPAGWSSSSMKSSRCRIPSPAHPRSRP